MKNTLKKKQSNLPVQDTVDQKRTKLQKLLPKAKSGTVIASIQVQDFCVSIPVPLPEKIKKYIKTSKTKSRTVTDSGDFKIALDII